MKLKDRIKTYNFWVSLSSAVFLILKVLGQQLGFYVNESIFTDLITSLCGILVILGIIVPPTNKETIKNSSATIQIPTFVNENNSTICNKEESQETVILTNEKEFKTIQNETNDVIETVIEETAITETEDDNIQIQNDEVVSESKIVETSNNIKEDLVQTLDNFESQFGENIDDYVELLQNKINIIKNK